MNKDAMIDEENPQDAGEGDNWGDPPENAIRRWIATHGVPSHITLAPIKYHTTPPPEGFWNPEPAPTVFEGLHTKKKKRKRDYKGDNRRRKERAEKEEWQHLARLEKEEPWESPASSGRACPQWLTPPPEESELQQERLALGLECSIAVMGANGRRQQERAPRWTSRKGED